MEHYEPKQASRWLGMLRQILTCDVGDLGQVIDCWSGQQIPQSGAVLTLQAGIQDEDVRDHFAQHTGRLDTFEKMVVEVPAIARTRLGESYLVPIGPRVPEWKGKAKDAKGQGKGSKGRGKGTESKFQKGDQANKNQKKKCFNCDMVGHVKSECRKKVLEDEQLGHACAMRGSIRITLSLVERLHMWTWWPCSPVGCAV